MGRFAQGLPPRGPAGVQQAAAPEDAFTDLLHYDLNIQIDPTPKTISGSNEMTLASTVDGLTHFTFRLQDNYAIASVLVNGLSGSWTRLDSIHVRVQLVGPFNTGEQFTVKVQYSGVPVNNGFDSILFTTHNGTPIVSTLSETNFAYTWWPTKDDNRDKCTADLRFSVPPGYSVASNGVLQSVTGLGGIWDEWHWKTNYPTATYLFSFALTNYNRFSGTYVHSGGSMPLEFFIYPENDTPSNRNAWLAVAPMLTAFKPIFGLYPFINEKYGIYQFPFGGGMEHQTMTGQGTFSESVTAHELAHQWWGDDVTCAFWNDIWLNEGFATYGEALWYENKPGSTGMPALHAAMAVRRPSSVNGTVYKHEPLNLSDLSTIFSTSFSYRKPAWVLHMLRRVIGDTAFFDTLAAYRATFTGKSATTEDFRAVAEQVSGRDLSWFFNQWVYLRGAPAYQSAWRSFAVNNQRFVELYLSQVQSAQYPIFTMPVDVLATIGGSGVTHTVWNDAATEHLMFRVSGTPTAVQVDPTPWILATSNTSVSFVQGPPKVVEVSPAPGSEGLPGSAAAIDVWFSKNVVAQQGDFLLVGETAGIVPVTLAYSSSLLRARLTPTASLAADEYTLTIAQSIVDVAISAALDGETADPLDPASLPSGNGQAGGNCVVTFRIVPPACPGDADGNGVVDFVDITAVLSRWGQAGPVGDANADGIVDFEDITTVLANWGAICS